jgi:cyclohexanecarboxylate-CoA ligase
VTDSTTTLSAASPAQTTTSAIWQLIREQALAHPDRTVVTDERRGELTYRQLHDRAETVAAGLTERGMRPGDVVSWQLPSRVDAIILVAALARLGVQYDAAAALNR